MSNSPGPETPLTATGLTSPFGMLRFAEDYRLAAEIIRKQTARDLSTQAYMLMGRSIELSLKAFLMARGMSIAELKFRPYGHDLQRLLDKALALKIERLVALQSFNIDAIKLISPYYANHEFRYIVTGTKSVPTWGFLGLAASLLTSGLHDHLLRLRIGRTEAKQRIALRGKF